MKGIVWTGELEVRDDVEVRDPRPGRGAGAHRQRRPVPQRRLGASTARSRSRRPSCSATRAPASSRRSAARSRKVKVGDHVVLTTLGNCGRCAACDRGQPTHCRDTFGRLRAPVHRRRREGVQLRQHRRVHRARSWSRRPRPSSSTPRCRSRPPASSAARSSPAPARCSTGPRSSPGQTVAVIGAGGIGQSTIQAARIAAAGRIVVIDANPEKEAVARRFGATDFVDASAVDDTIEAVKELGLPNGLDHVFECVGHTALIRQGVDLLDWGGTLTLLGVPKIGTEASFVVSTLYNDKSILGCRYGVDPPAPRHPPAGVASTRTAGCCSTTWSARSTRSTRSRRPSTTCTTASSTAACSRCPDRRSRRHRMEFGVFAQLFVPQFERDQDPHAEHKRIFRNVEIAKAADRNAFKYVWCPQHHFLDEYTHMPGPEAFLGVLRRARPSGSTSARRSSTSRRRSTSRSASPRTSPCSTTSPTTASSSAPAGARRRTEVLGLRHRRASTMTKAMWRETIREIPKMWKDAPYSYDGEFFRMPERKVFPKPNGPLHPAMWVAGGSPGTFTEAGRARASACSASRSARPQDMEPLRRERTRRRSSTPRRSATTSTTTSWA